MNRDKYVVVKRQEARMKIMQLLYSLELQGSIGNKHEALQIFKNEYGGLIKPYSEILFKHILDNLSSIDEIIHRLSHKWDISRIARVDLAILRVAIGEIQANVDTEVAVVVSQAGMLARNYSTAESEGFVKGIVKAYGRSIDD